jgi:hypothetical protein
MFSSYLISRRRKAFYYSSVPASGSLLYSTYYDLQKPFREGFSRTRKVTLGWKDMPSWPWDALRSNHYHQHTRQFTCDSLPAPSHSHDNLSLRHGPRKSKCMTGGRYLLCQSKCKPSWRRRSDASGPAQGTGTGRGQQSRRLFYHMLPMKTKYQE